MTAFKTTAVAFVLALALTVGTSQVQADEVSQEQTVEVECETGSYGQTSTCKTKTNQKQRVLGVNRVVKTHDITGVNTGLTSAQKMVAMAILALGASAAAYKISNRAV